MHSYFMNKGPIRTIFLIIKMLNPSYRFTSLQLSKSQKSFFTNIPGIVAPLATYLPASYTTSRDITMIRGAFHTFLRRARETQCISSTFYTILRFKTFSSRHNKLVHTSYFSHITNHYQNVRNDHANATKATKYIQYYRYKKSALKSETTKMKGSTRSQENILFFGPYKSPQ